MEKSNFHNEISKLCLDHFHSLPKTGKPTKDEWTIMSCIVKEGNSKLEVVALGTGSKCIGASSMSLNGDILNDSHAEIICRRSFLLYLFKEINKCLESKTSIFVFQEPGKKFKLNNTKFHFFTTHVPCGDAAIFPKQCEEDYGAVLDTNLKYKAFDNDTKTSRKRKADVDENLVGKYYKTDIYRTGAKCLQGNPDQDPKLQGLEYHKTGVVRTKPGRGDPTLSVSCSDKITKWCYLGIQGALLAYLLTEPIYLTSFTIAGDTPFCEKSLKRALYDRINDIQLVNPYRQNILEIGQAVYNFDHKKDSTKIPCPSSISWLKTTDSSSLEVAVEGKRQGVTKKKLHTKSGRLKICKLELFCLFMDILKKINDNKMENMRYIFAKQLATEYQTAWSTLKGSLKTWTVKDEKFNYFTAN